MSSEIQAALDKLDIRVAMGEIDLGTYQTLKAKFTAQMNQGTPTAVQAAVDALPRQTYILKCACGAALQVTDPNAVSAECEYCGGVSLLRPAEDAAERLQASMRKWIAEQTGGIAASGTIDEASRKFIFGKLLPTLNLEANRANESFSVVRHAALFSFPLTNEIPDSPFVAALRSLPNFAYVKDKLQLTEARVEAPELLAFAVTESDKRSLGMIGALCRESMRMAKVRECLMRFDADGFSQTLANLRALREIYGQVTSLAAGDAPRESFARGLERRITAVSDATTQLASLHRQTDGVMTDPIVSRLERIATECEGAAVDIDGSGVEARERVPAVEGTRADAQTIRILRDSVSLFGMCGAENGNDYQQFASSLSALAARAREQNANLDWLSGFMSRLALHVSALNGDPVVASLTDYSALELEATNAARSSMFAGKENAAFSERLLVPFWLAELQFSQQTGVIFKTGKAAQELLFVEASGHGGRWLRASTDSPLGARAVGALDTPNSVSRSNNPLVPVVSSEKALGTLKKIVATTQGFAGGQPRILGLVYLPALRAVYSTKKAQRTQLFIGSGTEFGDLSPARASLGTVELRIA